MLLPLFAEHTERATYHHAIANHRFIRRDREHLFAKTAAPYALAFLVPFVALLAAFAASGIYPFGDVSVMLYDMPLQYVDYFGWFSDVLRGDADLLYSNAAGLGGGMFSLFSYYLASPFNLLAPFGSPKTCRNSSACCIC